MKILVTGSQGYIGHRLMPRLHRSTIGIDQQPGAAIQDCISNLEKYVDRLSEVTHVIHLADVRLGEYTASTLKDNLARQKKFVFAVSKLPLLKRVVMASSCSVYGYSENPIDEKSNVNPTSHYAEGKVAIERLFQEAGLEPAVIRFGTAYGLSPKMRWDLLPNQMAKSLVHEEEIEIFDPEALRPYVHAQDFAGALIHALDAQWTGVINVAETSLSKAQLIQRLPRVNPNLKINTGRKDIRNYRIDTSNASQLGFRFQREIGEGMGEICLNELN